jgi:hypothetical protein
MIASVMVLRKCAVMMVVEGRCSVRDEAMVGIRGMVELMRLVEIWGAVRWMDLALSSWGWHDRMLLTKELVCDAYE